MRKFGDLGLNHERRHSKGNNRINLPPEVQRVLNALREVKDPETDLNIVDEGLIYGLTIEDRTGTARIRLLFLRATPICKFCQVIAIRIQRKIVSDVISVLRRIGFYSIKVYNEAGLLLDEWKASQE